MIIIILVSEITAVATSSSNTKHQKQGDLGEDMENSQDREAPTPSASSRVDKL